MTIRARQRGLSHFRALVEEFSESVSEGKERSQRIASPSGEAVQGSDALRDAIEELRTHQEELSVADEEMRVQLDELSLANARIHTERDRYRELFDLAPDAYFITDRIGAVRDVNGAGAAMLGIEPRFLLGKPLVVLVDAADTRVLREAVATLRTQTSTEVELRFKPRTGDPRWHTLKGVNVEQGAAILWIARDVQRQHDTATELATSNVALGVTATTRATDLERANRDKSELLERERRLRSQLEAEHAAKDRFLTMLSHDLRAPLNAVLGWTQLLRREKLDESARDRALATIERNAQTQLRLVEEVLDISRGTADRVQLERVPVELRELVQRAVDGAAAEAADRKVDLRVSLCAEELFVAGDRRRLARVTTNLLSNALKFTPSGGAVSLTLGHDGTNARLEVVDTGRGIAPEVLNHVFDAFRHASADHAIEHGGLGLGLYVVRQVVSMHGGSVVAESTGLGSGARFVVSLPLASVNEPRGEGELRPSRRPGSELLEGLRVLVVDDEDDGRELMATIMRQRGAVVAVAADVSAALQAFTVAQPDVLVSDISMPGRSGLDLARELRGRSTTTAAMIAVSGFTSPAEVESALDAGFDMHVAKPVDPGDLVDAVRDAARLRIR